MNCFIVWRQLGSEFDKNIVANSNTELSANELKMFILSQYLFALKLSKYCINRIYIVRNNVNK